MCGRGQISVEYLLVVSFAFLMLLPIILIAYSESATFEADVTAAQIEKVGLELADAINAVYYAGPPTKRTVKLYFPSKIQDIELSGTAIIFSMDGAAGQYEYAVPVETNITGTLQPFSGTHTIIIQASGGEVNITDS